MKKVNVIGAGFAGLTLSLRLAQKGFQVELFEKSNRLGGLLGTEHTEHGIAERAANALICNADSLQLFKELGLTPSIPLKSSRRRFLFRQRPRQWPLNLKESVALSFRLLPKLIRGKKNLMPQSGESLQSWGQKTLGTIPTKYLLEPAIQGIYGNALSGLSASLILGPIFTKKKSKYRGLLTSSLGMQELVNKLSDKCRDLGVKIHLNANFQPQKTQTPTVIACSARQASTLLQDLAPETSQALLKIRMSSIVSLTLFFTEPQLDFQGFGCLIPRDQGLKSLGVLLNSYIFEDRNKTYNETWILGGIEQEELFTQNDQELLTLVLKEREIIFSRKDEIIDYRINRWPQALPYYDLQLEKTLKTLANYHAQNGFYLHGNYLAGIGLSKILERSNKLAEEIASKYV